MTPCCKAKLLAVPGKLPPCTVQSTGQRQRPGRYWEASANNQQTSEIPFAQTLGTWLPAPPTGFLNFLPQSPCQKLAQCIQQDVAPEGGSPILYWLANKLVRLPAAKPDTRTRSTGGPRDPGLWFPEVEDLDICMDVSEVEAMRKCSRSVPLCSTGKPKPNRP